MKVAIRGVMKSGKRCEPDCPSWVVEVTRTEGPVASSLGHWEYQAGWRKERMEPLEKSVKNGKIWKVLLYIHMHLFFFKLSPI